MIAARDVPPILTRIDESNKQSAGRQEYATHWTGRDLLLVANLMQRYNPLISIIERLIESGALGELLRAVTAGQTAWIRDRSHPRRVTGQNDRDSLALAVAADRLAHE